MRSSPLMPGALIANTPFFTPRMSSIIRWQSLQTLTPSQETSNVSLLALDGKSRKTTEGIRKTCHLPSLPTLLTIEQGCGFFPHTFPMFPFMCKTYVFSVVPSTLLPERLVGDVCAHILSNHARVCWRGKRVVWGTERGTSCLKN